MSPSRITCVVTAYNYGQYIARALDSILAQDYPQELIEIVVVDDGSTDDTPAVVAPYLDRIRYVRKENEGLNSAYERGLTEATGDAIAFLDADDEWPVDKLSRQIAVLRARPEVGLVYGDLEVIDPDGEHVHPSYLRLHRIRPRRGAILGTLIHDNVVTGGSAMVRAEIAKARLPIPAWVAFPDWWVALAAAEVSDIDYVTASVYRYRLHGSNMGFGVDPKVRLVGPVRERELPFRRELLVRLEPGAVPAAELLVAHRRFTSDWHAVARALDVDLRTLIPVEPARLARADAACAEAARFLDQERIDEAAARVVAALADDPWDGRAEIMLTTIAALADHRPAQPPAQLETRSFAVGVRGSELLEEPELAEAYLTEISAADDITLVVHSDEAELTKVVEALMPTLERLGDAAADVVAVTSPTHPIGEQTLARRLDAVLSNRVRRGAFRTLPQLGTDRIAQLRQLAAHATATRVLLAVDSFHPAPGEPAAAIGAALVALGCDVQIATTALAERTELARDGVEIVELDPANAIAELERLAADGRADVIVALGAPLSWPVIATLELARAETRCVVVPIVDDAVYDATHAQPLLLERYRQLLGNADLVLFESHAGADARLLRDLGITGVAAVDAAEVAAAAIGSVATERRAA